MKLQAGRFWNRTDDGKDYECDHDRNRRYMAPEVAKKMKYGKSVDTYSLGLVLYWLLNDRRLPFVPEKDRISVKDMQEAYRLRMRGEEIPEPKSGSRRLKEVVLKSLSFDREKRYRSGKEMLEAITDCKVPKEKEIEQTEVYEDECWDDYDGETIGS